MSGIDLDLYRSLVEAAPEGVVLTDAGHPDYPVVYVNASFQAMTGYSADELIGRNLRLLQREDRDQESRHRVRESMDRGGSCHVLIRNYRKDGMPFWNDMTLIPLRDAQGQIKHYIGYHRDASERYRAEPHFSREGIIVQQPVLAPVRDDRLTGLYTLLYLEELLKRDWAVAQRERRSIALFAIDIDELDAYNGTFGRAAGDSAIRRVAHCVAGCLRRASDVTARVDGGTLLAFAPGLTLEQALRQGATMAERVRELHIHHPRSTVLRYVSISVGAAAAVPDGTDAPAALLAKAQAQLRIAKRSGRNRAA